MQGRLRWRRWHGKRRWGATARHPNVGCAPAASVTMLKVPVADAGAQRAAPFLCSARSLAAGRCVSMLGVQGCRCACSEVCARLTALAETRAAEESPDGRVAVRRPSHRTLNVAAVSAECSLRWAAVLPWCSRSGTPPPGQTDTASAAAPAAARHHALHGSRACWPLGEFRVRLQESCRLNTPPTQSRPSLEKTMRSHANACSTAAGATAGQNTSVPPRGVRVKTWMKQLLQIHLQHPNAQLRCATAYRLAPCTGRRSAAIAPPLASPGRLHAAPACRHPSELEPGPERGTPGPRLECGT